MSGTSDDAENEEGSSGSTKPDLTALVSAASALVTAVGALALTGALGRVQRNSGELFALAIGAIILGATLAAIGSMISLKARPSLRLTDRHIGLRAAIQGAGVALTATGLVFGLAVTIGTADNNESPSLTFSMPEETGRPITGVVTAGSMSSNDRLTVDVDRLKRTEGQDEYKHDRRLFRAVVGPNGDGDASTNVLIPASGGPTGIRAYVAEGTRSTARDTPASPATMADRPAVPSSTSNRRSPRLRYCRPASGSGKGQPSSTDSGVCAFACGGRCTRSNAPAGIDGCPAPHHG